MKDRQLHLTKSLWRWILRTGLAQSGGSGLAVLWANIGIQAALEQETQLVWGAGIYA